MISTWSLLYGAITIPKVFSRGFLLGAAEWLLMIPVGVIFTGKTVAEILFFGSQGLAKKKK